MKRTMAYNITTKDVLKRILKVSIPILIYGSYGYLTKDWVIEFGEPNIDYNSLYGRAADAISKSDMGSFYKNLALQNLRSDESDAYYEAVISIVNGNMGDFYKAESISNLVRKK